MVGMDLKSVLKGVDRQYIDSLLPFPFKIL